LSNISLRQPIEALHTKAALAPPHV